MENSSCLNATRIDYSKPSWNYSEKKLKEIEGQRELDRELRHDWDAVVNDLKIGQIEQMFKSCVAGKIK